MKSILAFLRNLFVVLFPSFAERIKMAKTTSINLSSVVVPITNKTIPVIQQRRRLSQIMDMVVLPQVRAEIIGKHQVRCETENLHGRYKLLGQIGTGGFARIRRFGDGSDTPTMVRLVTQ